MKKLLCWLLVFALLMSGVPALAESSTVLLAGNSKGTPVKLLQYELKELGHYSGEIDGKYGDTTRQAVSAFREAQGLSAGTGVDEATVLALYRARGSKTLVEGDRGVEVYAVQCILYFSGFLAVEPDGNYGSGTAKALKGYMTYYKDEMQAFLDEKAAEAEKQALANVPVLTDDEMPLVVDEPLIRTTANTDGEVNADWMEFIFSGRVGFGPTLKQGDKNTAVKRMQLRLKALKYLAAGTDGSFGSLSVLALKYFQQRNGLEETGELDAETQRKLYSANAKASDQYVSPYKAYVSRSKNRVRIYKWTGSGYDKLAKEFKCTTGKKSTPTIAGTFQAVGQAGVRWWKMTGCWVQYCFIIDGGYFFHSLLYSRKGASRPTSESVANLGRNASHGCVRLQLKDAKWIYDNCAPGMTVVIK